MRTWDLKGLEYESLAVILLTVIFFFFKIPQKLVSFLKDLLDVKNQIKSSQDVEIRSKLEQTNHKLEESRKLNVELLRELDIRKEINSQDTETIRQLKAELDGYEKRVIELRKMVLSLEEALDATRKKYQGLGGE